MRVLSAEFVDTIVKGKDRKDTGIAEVCFIGRSNVGKSSLINRLVMRKVARTSSVPGATRAINLFRITYEFGGGRHRVIFSDFPGFGYSKAGKSVSRSWEAMIDEYVTGNKDIRSLAWAFDVRRDPDEMDRTVYEWIQFNRLPFSLILTKSDKVGRAFGLRKKDFLRNYFQTDSVFLFSSRDGQGREEVLSQLLIPVAYEKERRK